MMSSSAETYKSAFLKWEFLGSCLFGVFMTYMEQTWQLWLRALLALPRPIPIYTGCSCDTVGLSPLHHSPAGNLSFSSDLTGFPLSTTGLSRFTNLMIYLDWDPRPKNLRTFIFKIYKIFLSNLSWMFHPSQLFLQEDPVDTSQASLVHLSNIFNLCC